MANRKQPIGGSRKGRPNKTTKVLKEAILMAAELEGSDGGGKDGLVGYLRRVFKVDTKTAGMLLAKVLPLTIAGDQDKPLTVVLKGDDANL